MFNISLKDSDLSSRVKSVIGIPDAFLNDSVITSPDFKYKAEIYINSQLNELNEIYEEEEKEVSEEVQRLIDMSAIYYIAYLLCVSMPVRLPNRMENISTKTLLQTIDWYKFAEEMLGRCDDLLSKILEDEEVDSSTLGNTVIALSDETTYPNEMM